MSQDSALFGWPARGMAAIVALTLVATACLIGSLGLAFPPIDALQPTAIVAGLLIAATYYHWRGIPNFVVTLEALAALVAFTTVYAVLMYAIAATARPWADASLAGLDTAMGFSAARVVAWVDARPAVSLVLEIAYFSVIPQTILAIVWLGLRDARPAGAESVGTQSTGAKSAATSHGRAALERFLLRFMVAAGLTALVFFFVPARGSCAYFGFETPAHYRQILVDLDAMRSGARTLVTWRGADGLITCPSFHTTWGVLLVMAFWPDRWLRWPSVALNSLMIASTVPIGMHYLTDVLGGMGVALATIALERTTALARTAVRSAAEWAKHTRVGDWATARRSSVGRRQRPAPSS